MSKGKNPMPRTPTVYLAGPDVFLPDALAVIAEKVKMCAQFGFKALIPGDNHIEARTAPGPATQPPAPAPAPADMSPTTMSREIYAVNVATMKKANFGIFNLTPFRGISADVGTAFELGMMSGMGKPVFAYTNVSGDYIDRIWLKQQKPPPAPPRSWCDGRAWGIENFGNADNLMLDGAVAAAGSDIVREAAALPHYMHDLDGFRACLVLAAKHYGTKQPS